MKNSNLLIKIVAFCISEFRNGKAPILIATDVASRGLGMLEGNAYTVSLQKMYRHTHTDSAVTEIFLSL